jgi:hypothetical protein
LSELALADPSTQKSRHEVGFFSWISCRGGLEPPQLL